MGFRVALDDAGAGNAGLELLSQLSIDFVKIDRAMVGRALTDHAAHSVLVGLATIARESHISMVAEGIESPEMLDLVQQLQVQYAQGYFLGRPGGTIPEASALQDVSQLLSPGSHEMPVTP
jgi:EAL domain-containing protein (putative c-di-GMP-specific phosphodiesterase class I)